MVMGTNEHALGLQSGATMAIQSQHPHYDAASGGVVCVALLVASVDLFGGSVALVAICSSTQQWYIAPT